MKIQLVAGSFWVGLAAAVVGWLPLLWLLSLALRPEAEFYQGKLSLIPDQWSIQALHTVAGGETGFANALWNSTVVAVCVAVVATACAIPAAFYFVHRAAHGVRTVRVLGIGLVAARFLPSASLLGGLYWIFLEWRLIDTLTALIVVNFFSGLSLAVLLLAPAVASIPQSFFEQAALEGAGTGMTLRSIVLPELLGAIAVVSVLVGIFAWNEFFLANVLTETASSQPISVLVAGGIGQYRIQYNILAAGALICAFPVLFAWLAVGLWRLTGKG